MVIHPCSKFGMPLSKRNDDFAKTQIQDEAKGHGRTEVIKMFDTSCHGITTEAHLGPIKFFFWNLL